MIVLHEMTDAYRSAIKRWPPYPPEFGPLDYALRDGGWLDAGCPYSWAAFKDGQLVGFTVLWLSDGVATVSIALHGEKLGRGLGYPVLCRTVDFCFSVLSCREVALDVRKTNPRAKKLYEKVGFHVTSEHTEEIRGLPVPFEHMVIDSGIFYAKNRAVLAE